MTAYSFPTDIHDAEGNIIEPECPHCGKRLHTVGEIHSNTSMLGFSEEKGARVLVDFGKDYEGDTEDLVCGECWESVENCFVKINYTWVWKADARKT